jgi:carboxyl-terminal processing protease
MKLSRAAAFLTLLLASCAGPRLPWQQQPPGGTATIQRAYNILVANYVDPPNPSALLDAAYQGATQELSKAGIQDASLQPPAPAPGQAASWDRFATAYSQLDAKYGKQLGAGTLAYAAISQMASSLKDCQTRFYDPTALKQRQAEVSGQQFGGIGVLMKNIPGHPTVLRVLNGPAQAAGLKPGDEILAVDGKAVQGESFEEVRNSIRGPLGSSVRLTIKRPGGAEAMDFTISRAQIQAPIIDAAILGNSIGYVHLYSFPQGITQEIDAALDTFDQKGVDSVILDVRANTGGDQPTIIAALSRFIKSGAVEIQVDRSGNRQTFSVEPSQFWKNPKPLIVLADEDTQAGGEIFAKAMQEEGGYRVIGMPTAGCAASAKSFDLGDGSALEVSVAKVISARGAEINRAGVKPDSQVLYPVEDLAAGKDPELAAALQALSSGVIGQPSSGRGPAASAPPAAPASGGPGDILKPIAPGGPPAGAGSILK